MVPARRRSGTPFPKRARLIEQFKSTTKPDEYRLLSNVRLLAEGVDVPGIDAIAFVDTRRGHAQIVQAVGRAVRTAAGKTVGTIVLPIVLRKDEAVATALARTEHRMVVDVLGALRSHDPGVVRSLDTLYSAEGPTLSPRRAMEVSSSTRPSRLVRSSPTRSASLSASALGVPVSPGRSGRPGRQAVVIDERPQPSPEEMFVIGCDELRKLARWRLLPRVPSNSNSFPLAAWWREAMQRWADGRLDPSDKLTIADAVSGSAPDLAGTAQRAETMALTDHSVPEQVAAQLRAGGTYASGDLSCLVEEGGEPDNLVSRPTLSTTRSHTPPCHRTSRSLYLAIALRRLAPAMPD